MSQYKPYPEYTDSGVEWMRKIPAHWEVKKIKQVAEIRYGIGEPPGYVDKGVPLIRATNVNAGSISKENLVCVNPQDIPSTRIAWLAEGDIIVVRSGAYTGDSAIIPSEYQGAIAGFDMVLSAKAISPLFLSFSLLSSYLKESQIDLMKMRAAQPHLNAEELGSCLLFTPPSEEQEGIASYIAKNVARIDALIDKKQRLIELLQEKRQAIITQAVTKGLDPDVPMKDSGVEWLGEVPAHWEVKPFKHAVNFQEGPGIMAEDFEDEGIPLLRIGNVSSRFVDLNGCNFLSPEKVAIRWKQFKVTTGDLLISASASMGTVSEVTEECEGAIPYTGIIKLVAQKESTIKDFIRHFVVSKPYIEQIGLLKAGATIQHYGPFHLRQIVMAIPPKKEQYLICEWLEEGLQRMDGIINLTTKSIDLLIERRSTRITAAYTGQIDVREAV